MASPSGNNGAVTRKVVLFCAIVVAWLALDQFTKSLFAGAQPGQLFGSTLGGLVNFCLVHNTGAAWGVFANSTAALGIFSLAVVAALVIYFIWDRKSVNLVQTAGIALIVAGGIGNAIDRFAQGYVTDFIAVTFIDFPVFNVADIGVTCGVAILLVGMIVAWRKEDAAGEKGADAS